MNNYLKLYDKFIEYCKYYYFQDNKNKRDILIKEIKDIHLSIESKFEHFDYTTLFYFLTNDVVHFHEYNLIAYKNILLKYPEFEINKNDDSETVTFYIGDNKYLISTKKTKIKNPTPGNIALSMIYENKNNDTLEKKEIKITDRSNREIAVFSAYTPFKSEDLTEDEILQLEIITDNVIKYMRDEIDKILNYILHLYTDSNLDWKVVIENGLWIRNSKPKKRYFKRGTHS